MRPDRRLIIVCALAALAVQGCSDANANGGAGGRARPYRVGAVDRGGIKVVVEETGVVEPERQIIVKSPISGVVERLNVREGDRVRRGRGLARIVPDIAQANVFAQIRSEIAAAEIARENADREYQRALELSRTGGIAQTDLDQRMVDLEQARNQYRTATDQLRLVELSGVTAADSAQWARITAPAAGVVIRRGVEIGETVVGGTSAFGGGTELFTIADLSTLLVKASVNEVDIGKVEVGDS
ncbi:MAG: HlyD family efflux transporter periplasmic adaptor subunit, partial [Gemmatimonadales bacterium]|nr:HlyD family efflux transporter periplasmic adaptor subunit [Gemmatimonadales bacterium]